MRTAKAGSIPAVLLAMAMLGSATAAHGATWVVDPGGGGHAATIAGGLALASYGDSVMVHPGTYAEHLVMKAGVVLKSRDGAAFTTIDGSGDGEILWCDGIGADAAIEGFTLTHARGDSMGGAITCLRGSSPRIAHNVIRDNYSRYGAAVGCAENSSPVVEYNEIIDNTAFQECGGVLGLNHCDLVVRNNVFRGNVSETKSGGAMWFGASCRVTVSDNFIADNSCLEGGGGIWYGRSGSVGAIIEHNVFVRNSCGIHGGAIYAGEALLTIGNNTFVDCTAVTRGGAIWVWTGVSVMENNIVTGCNAGAIGTEGPYLAGCNDLFDNPDGDYAGFMTPSADDIHVDPRFCDPGVDNYQLDGASPCLHQTCGIMGALGQGCGATATEHTSWGQLKALYR